MGEISTIHGLLFILFFIKNGVWDRWNTMVQQFEPSICCAATTQAKIVWTTFLVLWPHIISSDPEILSWRLREVPICCDCAYFSHCYDEGWIWWKSSSILAGRVWRCLCKLDALGRLAHDHLFEASAGPTTHLPSLQSLGWVALGSMNIAHLPPASYHILLKSYK